jgi:hypothetical protein
MDMTLSHRIALLVSVLAFGATAGAQGPPTPASGGGATAFRQIHITGENPGMRLRDKPGGTVLAEVNFWRVAWSPVGSGHVCFVTTGNGRGPNDLRLALYDNEKLVDYVVRDTMTKLVANFADPPYKPIRATFGFTGDSVHERTEVCRSPEYTVETTWRNLAAGNYGEMRPPNGFLMQFIIMMASVGEIRVNGTPLPGAVYPMAPGDGIPNAYLAFAETWRK